MTKRWLLLLALLLPLKAVIAASDPNLAQLQEQLAQQQKVLAEMQAKLAAMESKQAAPTEPNTGKLENKVVALQEAQAQQAREQQAMSQKMDYIQNGEFNWPKSMEWVKNVKLSGDFRYRYENIDSEGSDDQNRNRIRARLGITAKVNDDIDAGIRMATSQSSTGETNGDPVSTNQTLDDAFSKKEFWLDLAYVIWHPKDIAGLNVILGKMENPFLRVGSNQLIFDGDLTPEGVAVQYTKPLDEKTDLFVNSGGFYIEEEAAGADVSLWGIQGGLKHTFENKSILTGGASYYSYGNVEGHGALYGTGFNGNSNAGGVYISDYDVSELFGEYCFDLGKTPASVFASYVQNGSASTSDDAGWLIGASYNKCKDPGSWQLSYDYRDLEADAVLGAFSDSDFVGGGTNGKGHRFGGTYQLAKNVQVGLTYFMDERGANDSDYDRLQFDFLFKW